MSLRDQRLRPAKVKTHFYFSHARGDAIRTVAVRPLVLWSLAAFAALTLAADQTHATLKAYGVGREKSMFGNKNMGVERTPALVDPRGRIARLWRKVKVPGHAEEVLAALEAARAHLPTINPNRL